MDFILYGRVKELEDEVVRLRALLIDFAEHLEVNLSEEHIANWVDKNA